MHQDPSKESLGWNPFFEDHWNALASGSDSSEGSHSDEYHATNDARTAVFPARVVAEERGMQRLQQSLHDSFWGVPTGRARRDSDLYPSVGDWVVCSRGSGQERASVHAVLPRKSCLTRRAAGRSGHPQVLAANVDVGYVVTSLNSDLNPRRIERYLTTIWDGGSRPVVLLTKRDLCPDADPVIREIELVASGADVLALSAATGEGMEALDTYLRPGQTAALLGSSGAGKSTLLNRLFGAQVVRTQPIRDSDGRGRHTTTSRQLWVLPSGALVVDTPGMRELQLWVDAESLDQAFGDLRALASRCRFSNCRHRAEPGCEVRTALERGTLSGERLAAYDKLSRELEFQARKQDKAKASREKARWKKISREAQEQGRSKRW